MAIAMPISYATWSALINNFVVEESYFSGVEIGWLHGIREIPGFLAVGVILVLVFLREQTLACLALILLGIATAITTFLPSFHGLLLTTLLGSIGFHYFETVNQSLQLKWLSKERAPVALGFLISVGSLTSLIVYSIIVFGWEPLNFSFTLVFVTAGTLTFIISIYAVLGFKKFETSGRLRPKFVLKKINKSFGIPASSVLSDNGKKFIFTVNNKKLEKKEIKVLARFDEIYVIDGNIKSNDLIVTKDVSSLAEGQDILISK